MRALSLILLPLLPIILLTTAQNVTDQISLTSTLSRYANLSSFTTILNQFPDLLSQLANGNFTILAPSNNAIDTYYQKFSPPLDAQKALLTYHVVSGLHAEGDIQRFGVQFLSTLLTNISYANVTGGQRVEGRFSNDSAYFLSGLKDRSNIIMPDIIFGSTQIGIIHMVDQVLRIPENEVATVTDAHLNGFAQILTAVPPDPRIYGVVGTESDWTIFAANSSQISVEGMSEQDIFDLEAYHFVKGQVKYSTDLTDGLKLRTVLGKDVTITRLNGSIYVNAAKIIDPDYLITTGVLHLMDQSNNPNDTDARPTISNSTDTASGPTTSTSNLSVGNIAGIAVGAAVGILVVLSVAVFFLRRKKASTRRLVCELDSKEKNSGPFELNGVQRTYGVVESKSVNQAFEMDSGRPAASELSEGTERTR